MTTLRWCQYEPGRFHGDEFDGALHRSGTHQHLFTGEGEPIAISIPATGVGTTGPAGRSPVHSPVPFSAPMMLLAPDDDISAAGRASEIRGDTTPVELFINQSTATNLAVDDVELVIVVVRGGAHE